jgi:hypothetical protein
VGDFLSDMGRRLPWPFDPSKLVNNVKTNYYRRHHEILGGPGVDGAIRALLTAVVTLYAKHHVKFIDVSASNVGKNDAGELVIFDLGISDAPRVSIPTI